LTSQKLSKDSVESVLDEFFPTKIKDSRLKIIDDEDYDQLLELFSHIFSLMVFQNHKNLLDFVPLISINNIYFVNNKKIPEKLKKRSSEIIDLTTEFKKITERRGNCANCELGRLFDAKEWVALKKENLKVNGTTKCDTCVQSYIKLIENSFKTYFEGYLVSKNIDVTKNAVYMGKEANFSEILFSLIQYKKKEYLVFFEVVCENFKLTLENNDFDFGSYDLLVLDVVRNKIYQIEISTAVLKSGEWSKSGSPWFFRHFLLDRLKNELQQNFTIKTNIICPFFKEKKYFKIFGWPPQIKTGKKIKGDFDEYFVEYRDYEKVSVGYADCEKFADNFKTKITNLVNKL
jgi:hypothetical protein